MALNYEVKKRVFGFDETKTEKYVAQMKTLGVVGFKDLCDEVSKIGMAPRGVVKLVLDGLIDTLNMDINKGFSVQLGEFGCFRPGPQPCPGRMQLDSHAKRKLRLAYPPHHYT